MKLPIYFVNTFTDQFYTGNPAAVCVLEENLSDTQLQNIASEINLPATVFLLGNDGKYTIRWFAPEYEIGLCGHGTLASGYVIFNILEQELDQIVFYHPSKELIRIARKDSSLIIDFPAKEIEPIDPPTILTEGLGRIPTKTYQYKKERILAIYEKEEEILDLTPNETLLKNLEHPGIIVSAKGQNVDFVSRVFYPHKNIFEDQATGSSLCFLAPYWSQVFKKKVLSSQQLSKRGGSFITELHDNRISIHGKAVLYLQGSIVL